MKTLVVYDSVFGNAAKIAQTIAASLDTSALPVGQVTSKMMINLDVWVVGSPTHGFRPTEAIAKLLNGLPKDYLSGTKVAVFDTRILLDSIDSKTLRFIVDKGGYVASSIAKALKKKGGKLLATPEGFLVSGEQGPLKDGELERAAAWGAALTKPGLGV